MRLLVVDCENCSKALAIELGKFSVVYDLYYIVGAQQDESRYECLGEHIKLVKSDSTGKNAADFLLVAVILEQLNKKEYEEVIIISNDTGYDSIRSYIKKTHGIKISRLTYHGDNILNILKELRKKEGLTALNYSNNKSNLITLYEFILNNIPSCIEHKELKKRCEMIAGEHTAHMIHKMMLDKLLRFDRCNGRIDVYVEREQIEKELMKLMSKEDEEISIKGIQEELVNGTIELLKYNNKAEFIRKRGSTEGVAMVRLLDNYADYVLKALSKSKDREDIKDIIHKKIERTSLDIAWMLFG